MRDLARIRSQEPWRDLRADQRVRDMAGIIDADSMSRDDGWRYDLAFLAREIKRLAYAPFDLQPEAEFDRDVAEHFDSSAFVKLLAEETGSELAAEIWDGRDAAVSSRLAYPEVRAALAAAIRNHDLSDHDLDTAEQAWETYWAAATRPVELTPAVERHAGHLARSHALRGADAVHLASALAIGDPDLAVAVWDRRLRAGARTVGLRAAPARLSA